MAMSAEARLYLRQMELGPMQNFVYLVGDREAGECVVVDPAWEIDTIVRTAEADGALHLLAPYDSGVFYGVLEKAGLVVVSLPQLYADLKSYERRGPAQADHLRREAMGY